MTRSGAPGTGESIKAGRIHTGENAEYPRKRRCAPEAAWGPLLWDRYEALVT